MTQPFMGEIRMFSFDFPPRHWASAAGQLLSIQQNQALFSLLGTTYGGNGIQNFMLPDLRGRTPLHVGTGGGDFFVMGESGGSENVGLLATQMPQHNHVLTGTTATADKRAPGAHSFAADTSAIVDFYAPYTGQGVVSLAPTALATQGSNTAHPNMQPYAVVNFSIALQGRFPSRN